MYNEPSRSFRLTCDPLQVPLVEGLLRAQGFSFEPDPFFSPARKLTGGVLPLGSSLAALFGYIYIQDRSSMLPPLALAPAPGAAALDMCASPGGKTGMLAGLVGNNGFILANEPSKKRLGTLRRNLQVQNLFCCATMSFAGEALPLPDAGSCRRPGGADTDADASGRPCPGWESLLLDPPCSGWGTVEKHPAVTRLWQGDKVKPLISLQRRLLERAARLLRPGGRLTYSTCTTNVEENEAQVLYALEELGFALEALPPPPGFRLAEPELGGCDGVWRVPGGADGQGFFVARLRKTGAPARANATGPGRAEPEHEGASSSTGDRGFFARPWKKESRFVGERRRHGKTVGKAMGKGEGGRSGNPLDSGRRIPRESLAGPWLDPAKLPPGEIVVFNDVAHLLPEQSASLLPPSLAWKGFPLGRVGSGGEMRAFPSLRSLMPAADGHSLVVDDPAPVLALLAGQSLRVEGADNEAGLYYRDLPLCRLTVKGRRAMLPPL